MTEILNFAQFRTVNIDDENVCELLAASDYLCLPGIVQLCCDFLKNNLDSENCIGIMLFTR
jgi:hypothetical protein